MIDSTLENIPSSEPSPLEQLEELDLSPTPLQVAVDILFHGFDFVNQGPDSKQAVSLRVWAVCSTVCPTVNPPDQQTVTQAAKAYGVSTSHLYALKAQAARHFQKLEKKASLLAKVSSAGSNVIPPFSHEKGEKGQRARKSN